MGHLEQELFASGQQALRRGDLASARAAYERLVAVDAGNPQHWVHLALVCQGQKDEAGEERAIQKALALDPLELLALILKANLLERQGKRHQAAAAYGAVLAVSPPMERLHPDLRAAVSRARSYRQAYDEELGAFLEARLPSSRGGATQELRRFDESLGIMLGRKRRYDSQSQIYHYPGLAAIEFLDRDLFPWLGTVEAATDTIRDEFLAVLASEEGFTPYITYPEGLPLNQWVELNNSPRWSAFHLYKSGERVEGNAARCPVTMEALKAVPQPDQPGRTPTAMFSLLKPHTRIPPHTGVTNTRLVVHVPLIVPEHCGFRVGNTTRGWVPGEGFVFDDTIEHEAWNESDKLRVVLIFDVWHPHLNAAERSMITAMTAALNEFTGGELPASA